jgi:hypothetical protein
MWVSFCTRPQPPRGCLQNIEIIRFYGLLRALNTDGRQTFAVHGFAASS